MVTENAVYPPPDQRAWDLQLGQRFLRFISPPWPEWASTAFERGAASAMAARQWPRTALPLRGHVNGGHSGSV